VPETPVKNEARKVPGQAILKDDQLNELSEILQKRRQMSEGNVEDHLKES
jgi:hypothetical protein